MLVQIFLASFFVKVVAFAVDDDYKRHVLYIKLAQGFCAKILVGDQLSFFDAFGKKGAGTYGSLPSRQYK